MLRHLDSDRTGRSVSDPTSLLAAATGHKNQDQDQSLKEMKTEREGAITGRKNFMTSQSRK